MTRVEAEEVIKSWRDRMDDEDRYDDAIALESEIAEKLGIVAVRNGQAQLKMVSDDLVVALATEVSKLQ